MGFCLFPDGVKCKIFLTDGSPVQKSGTEATAQVPGKDCLMENYFVSFRPDIKMEVNLPPFLSIDERETQELLRGAKGVLLPAYVTPRRYGLITRYAGNWFPRLDARFQYHGKTRQVLLFRELGVRHPETLTFKDPQELMAFVDEQGPPWGYPMVLKGDTGGGGETVFPVYGLEDLHTYLMKLPMDGPLLIQRWVDHGGKDLRVVVYGDTAVSYFRVGDGSFYNNVCRGGRLDYEGWPELQRRGVEAVRSFSSRAKIDMAGYDLMFPDDGDPLFIEINFHFGRKGLGGTEGHRKYFFQAVENWRKRCLEA